MAEGMVTSAKLRDRANVEKTQAKVDKLYPPGQFASFLTNHDQDRVRSEVEDEGQAAVAASLYLLYPGVPFIYYGEEIGMQGVKPDEDIRRPMQWTSDGGFTTGTPWRPYFDDVETRNVAVQDGEASSLLNHYRGLIRLRNTYPALRTGDWRPVEVSKEAPSVYSFMRSQGDERFLVLINLGDKPVTDYALSLETQPAANASAAPLKGELVFGPKDALQTIPAMPAEGLEGYKPLPILPPYTTFVIRYMP
jgi:glycosidase